ncbi:hypothetical protein [Variovorax rhizosphaerae]|uniref:Uncharacterized protein n=1 Tax=Variovorax rhizosphaerae TaxID=1836200 RepID=A0ABU8WFA4_9BURK
MDLHEIDLNLLVGFNQLLMKRRVSGARRGIQRTVRLRVPHFVAVGHILARTKMIATLPQRLAEKIVEPFDLVSAKHPAPLPDTRSRCSGMRATTRIRRTSGCGS